MPSRLVALRQDAHDPAALAAFWAGLLQREVRADGDGPLLPGTEVQVGLRFTPGASVKVGPNAGHLHLTSATPARQQATVDAALALGARHLDVGQLPEEQHVVLADPEGNEFCVIEAGNSFLAGCGFLGELTCDGAPEVGRFWAGALGWPLVWDQDGQTAVQSPHGGTKISWDGWPDDVERGPDRQRFELVVVGGGLEREIDRLTALGAGRVAEAGDGRVELVDPGGRVFTLVDS